MKFIPVLKETIGIFVLCWKRCKKYGEYSYEKGAKIAAKKDL